MRENYFWFRSGVDHFQRDCHLNTVTLCRAVSAWMVCSCLSTVTTTFAFLFLFFLVDSFSGRSRRFLFRGSSSAPLATLRRILLLIPDFRYLEIFFHIFDLLIDIFSLACFLKELIEVPLLLNAAFNEFAVLDVLYQVFQCSVICLLAKLAIL